MAKKDPIDPLDGPKLVLAGRIVTMNTAFAVIPKGRLYIDKGSIVEHGTHDSLLAANGFYAELYHSQFVEPLAQAS